MPVVTALKIPLRRRDGSVRAYALVNPKDGWTCAHRWKLSSAGYAVRQTSRKEGPRRPLYLHREIMGLAPGDGLEVDHINHDPLDNRRENLRICTHRLNHQNRKLERSSTSGHRGVYSTRGRWGAQATIDGRHVHVGMFETKAEAAEAARAFRERHMPFANN